MSRRLYAAVSCAEGEDGFAVLLDGAALHTPGKLPLLLPTRDLALAIAAEWANQGEVIQPLSMPMTRLANVAIERTPQARAALAQEIRRYGETDLLHHRADSPEALVLRQAQAWDPILDWGAAALGVRLAVVQGVIAPARDASRLELAALALDDFRLTALAHATTVLGSAWLGFALMLGRIDAATGVRLARIDEDFQAERWGRDAEAEAAAHAMAVDAEAAARFFAALDGAGAAL